MPIKQIKPRIRFEKRWGEVVVELDLIVIFKIECLVLRNPLLSQSLGVILIPILGKNMLVEVVLVYKRPKGLVVTLSHFLYPALPLVLNPLLKWKKIEREVTWECIARWWYDADIPFNAARSIYYQPMLDAITSCGSGFKGPSFEDIRGECFKK